MESGREREAERWSAWMVAAQEGNEEAYAQLLAELYGCIEAFLRRMLHDPSEVEDCVQESLLAVHRARATYDASRPFRPWLFAIVRNKAFDAGRSRKRRPGALGEDADRIEARSVDPASALDLEALLRRLPVREREAVVLTKFDGLPTAEAAAALGISGTALRTRVHRGMKQLKRLGAASVRDSATSSRPRA